MERFRSPQAGKLSRPIVNDVGSHGQSCSVPLDWDGTGPLALYFMWDGHGDGTLEKYAQMGTTWEPTKDEMGWNGTILSWRVGGTLARVMWDSNVDSAWDHMRQTR